jgi:hypothetical protein
MFFCRAKGMERIEEEVGARLPLHRLWLEPKPELCLTIMAVRQLPKAERFSRAWQLSIMRIADFHVIQSVAKTLAIGSSVLAEQAQLDRVR